MLLKYHNDINKLRIGHFNEKETDIFFGLLLKIKEEQLDIVEYDFNDLKTLVESKNRSDNRLINSIMSLNRKLKMMIQEIQLPNGDIVVFGLFNDIVTSPKNKKISISVNKHFRYLIDDLLKNFTIIDLKQLISLNSGYSKTLYRLLKQFESTGNYKVKIDDFKNLMNIPESYLMRDIRRRVLKKVSEDLEQYFNNLEIVEMKSGRQVTGLEFSWNNKKVTTKKEKAISGIIKKSSLGEKDLEEHMEKLEFEKEKTISKKENSFEKRKITKEDFEKIYHEHLEKHNVDDNPIIKKFFMAKYEIIDS